MGVGGNIPPERRTRRNRCLPDVCRTFGCETIRCFIAYGRCRFRVALLDLVVSRRQPASNPRNPAGGRPDLSTDSASVRSSARQERRRDRGYAGERDYDRQAAAQTNTLRRGGPKRQQKRTGTVADGLHVGSCVAEADLRLWDPKPDVRVRSAPLLRSVGFAGSRSVPHHATAHQAAG